MKNLRYYAFLSLIISLFSCYTDSTTSKSQDNQTYTFISDSIAIEEIIKTRRNIKKWSDLDPFYSVYQFSDNNFGIAFLTINSDEFSKNYHIIDSVMYSSAREDDKVVLETLNFSLKKSETLQKAIFKNDTSRYFNIYGKRGVTKGKITEVLYFIDECTDIIVFKFSTIDTLVCGEPLIASKNSFQLEYGENINFQKSLEKQHQIWKKVADFPDSIIPKTFAYNDSLFGVYHDDFMWQKGDSKCSYPGRSVYQRKGNKIYHLWSESIDLFGIPCL